MFPPLTASACPDKVTPAGSMGMIHSGRIRRSISVGVAPGTKGVFMG